MSGFLFLLECTDVKSGFIFVPIDNLPFRPFWLIAAINTLNDTNFLPRTQVSLLSHYLRKRLGFWLELMAQLKIEAIKIHRVNGSWKSIIC